MAAEGVKFVNNVEIGKNMDAQQLLQENDAVLLAVGSTCPRDIPLPGKLSSVLKHIHARSALWVLIVFPF